MTSKNDLNRPLYDPANTGVTAIRPSAAATASRAAASRAGGNPVTKCWAVSVARSLSSMT